jgi:hypothetical protein
MVRILAAMVVLFGLMGVCGCHHEERHERDNRGEWRQNDGERDRDENKYQQRDRQREQQTDDGRNNRYEDNGNSNYDRPGEPR